MAEAKKVVITNTRGLDDERASVAWSVANAGLTAGNEVTMFLTSSAVDWAREGAADGAHLNPFDPPMKEMIDSFRERGGEILVCPPCAKVRGYDEGDLLDDIALAGGKAVHELIQQGAATLSF